MQIQLDLSSLPYWLNHFGYKYCPGNYNATGCHIGFFYQFVKARRQEVLYLWHYHMNFHGLVTENP